MGKKAFMTLPCLLWRAGMLTFFLVQILRKRWEAVNNSHCCCRRALTFHNSISRNNELNTSPLLGFISPTYILRPNVNAKDLETNTFWKKPFHFVQTSHQDMRPLATEQPAFIHIGAKRTFTSFRQIWNSQCKIAFCTLLHSEKVGKHQIFLRHSHE